MQHDVERWGKWFCSSPHMNQLIPATDWTQDKSIPLVLLVGVDVHRMGRSFSCSPVTVACWESLFWFGILIYFKNGLWVIPQQPGNIQLKSSGYPQDIRFWLCLGLDGLRGRLRNNASASPQALDIIMQDCKRKRSINECFSKTSLQCPLLRRSARSPTATRQRQNL